MVRPNSNRCLFYAATGDNRKSDLATDLEHDHTYCTPLAQSGCIICSEMHNLRPLVVLKERRQERKLIGIKLHMLLFSYTCSFGRS